MVECLIASVVLATCVVCVSGALTAASLQNERMDVESRCISEASRLMEEIAARPFDRADDADPAALLQCIGDYQGCTRQVVPSSAHPTSIVDSITFTSVAQLEYRAAPSGPVLAGGDFALITVTTTPSASGAPVVLQRMVCRYTQVR